MAVVEAVLMYSPACYAGEETIPIPIGRTSHPRALAVLRELLLEEAEWQVDLWKEVDPGLEAMRLAEKARLNRVLDLLLPNQKGGGSGLRVLESGR